MKKICILVILMILLLSMSTNAYGEKIYSCDKLNIDIILSDDGSARFEEYWTMSYKGGTFTKFARNIPLNDNYSISDFEVSEGNIKYTMLDGFDSNKPEKCYAVDYSDDELNLEIYYRANNESKIFHMSYVLNNAVNLHNDIAEFYWKVIGDEWDIPINNVTINIILPSGAVKDEIRAWAHGPLDGIVTIENPELVTLKVDEVDSYTYVEARVLTPTKLFINYNNKSNNNELNRILAEEQKYANDANKQRENAKINVFTFVIIPIIIVVIIIIILSILCKKFSKRFTPEFKPEYYRELSSSNISPSEVVDLMGYYNPIYSDSQRFTATLLDLNLKGYISFRKETEKSLFRNKEILLIDIKDINDRKVLKRHEQVMLDFIIDIANGRSTIQQNEIQKYINRHQNTVIEIFNKFKKYSKEEIENLGYIDHSIKKHSKVFVLFAISSIVLGVISLLLEQFILFIGMIVVFITSVLCCALLKRLTQKGEDELALWEGFKNFLKDFTSFNEKELPDIVLWERYIVYAVAVGMGKKILEELPIVYHQLNDDSYCINHRMTNMYILYNICDSKATVNDSMFKSINSIGNAISTAFSTQSSASGSGGGFSAGGGGGGGGGGGSCS